MLSSTRFHHDFCFSLPSPAATCSLFVDADYNCFCSVLLCRLVRGAMAKKSSSHTNSYSDTHRHQYSNTDAYFAPSINPLRYPHDYFIPFKYTFTDVDFNPTHSHKYTKPKLHPFTFPDSDANPLRNAYHYSNSILHPV